jgi:hypothetical protein
MTLTEEHRERLPRGEGRAPASQEVPTMTTTTTGAQSHEDYTTSAGLRALLRRLHQAGNRAWEHDPVAASLMSYAADKYAALARKHGLDPWEAASAAFDVLRTRSAREANDPWGVVTHAVRITCIAEERAQGLLCSTHQARRPHYSVFHDAERLSDRETPLSDYHPAFQITDPEPDPDPAGNGGSDNGNGDGGGQASMSASSAAEDAIALVTMLGWEPGTARASVEHICGALAKAGARHTAFENLRRDKYARALLDLPGRSWIALLKALLGNPHPSLAATPAGRGVLLRLLIGETLPVLLRDDDLVLMLWLAAPSTDRK